MKIAQMVVQPVLTVDVVEAAELSDTARSTGGFGSTGNKATKI
jgi:dUTP pyrophosphatase